MRIIRIFPRKTKATPDDEDVRIGCGPGLLDDCDEAHISVSFSWDLEIAEHLAEQWKYAGKVLMGGPAVGTRGFEFVPGMYLKHGYVITSRGCPNKCWFCEVWKREGNIRELQIKDGWNVLDDNLLACSERHIRSVFSMLTKVKSTGHRIEFTGGLEAARLRQWHVDLLRSVKPKQLFFAYDTHDDLDPLYAAGKLLLESGFTRASKSLRCYVLCGYPKDTFESAEIRMRQSIDAGFVPMAMLFRDRSGNVTKEWKAFQRIWTRPAIINSIIKNKEFR